MLKVYNNAELCLIWLDSFNRLEYKHKLQVFKIIKGAKSISEALKENRDKLILELGAERYSILTCSATPVYFKFVMDGLKSRGITAVTLESEEYPKDLAGLEIPPLVLYAKGNLSLLKGKLFSIVGSRKSLPFSIGLAGQIAKNLSKNGFTIVTGIAEGIDKAVIDGVLETNKAPVSVIAGGFDNVYPAVHKNLVDEIIKKSGLVLTEHTPEVISKPYFFPIRNRIIAGLSRGTLVVSAGKKSGAIYTAEYCMEYGKDLFAVPFNPGVLSGVGCNDLIKRGAILTESHKDILEFYGIEESSPVLSLSEEERAILAVLAESETHVEKIAQKLCKKVVDITPVLSIMEIKGLIVKTGVNVYGVTVNLEE